MPKSSLLAQYILHRNGSARTDLLITAPAAQLQQKIEQAKKNILLFHHGFMQTMAGIRAGKNGASPATILYDFIQLLQPYYDSIKDEHDLTQSRTEFDKVNDFWLLKNTSVIGIKAAKAIHDQLEFSHIGIKAIEDELSLNTDGNNRKKVLIAIKAILKDLDNTINSLYQIAKDSPQKKVPLFQFIHRLERAQLLLQNKIDFHLAYDVSEQQVTRILAHLEQKFIFLDQRLGTEVQIPITLNLVPNSELFLKQLQSQLRKNPIAFSGLPEGGRRVRECFLRIEKAFALFAEKSEKLMLEIKQMANAGNENVPVAEKPFKPQLAKSASFPE